MAAALSLSFFVTDGLACKCAGRPVWMKVSESDVVFIGKVLSVRSVENETTGDEHTRQARFQVETCFKGDKQSEIIVGTSLTTCGIWFGVGERYLVFARAVGKENRFFTGVCSGTDEVKDSAAEIAFLKFQASRKTGTFVTGHIARHLEDLSKGEVEHGSFGNVKVALQDGERKFESRADASGKFWFEGIPAGKYKVTLDPMPDKTRLEFFPQFVRRKYRRIPEVLVVSGQGGLSLEVNIRRAYGQITGRIIRPEGASIRPGELELVLADRNVPLRLKAWRRTARIDPDGNFRFERVPAGTFVIGFRKANPSNQDDPFLPQYFLPGTTDIKAATVIRFEEGATVTGLELRLPVPESAPK